MGEEIRHGDQEIMRWAKRVSGMEGGRAEGKGKVPKSQILSIVYI